MCGGNRLGSKSNFICKGGDCRKRSNDDESPKKDGERPGANQISGWYPIELNLAEARRSLRMQRRRATRLLPGALIPEHLDRIGHLRGTRNQIPGLLPYSQLLLV